jgi:hypothetical protein
MRLSYARSFSRSGRLGLLESGSFGSKPACVPGKARFATEKAVVSGTMKTGGINAVGVSKTFRVLKISE